MEHDVTAEVAEVLPEEEIRICLFSIGEEYYALPVSMLTEIIILQKIFPVPTTPSHVLGVLNLRGTIIPIVDIRPALALRQKSNPAQIIIIEHGHTILGIAVDNVLEVISVPESSLLPSPPEHAALQAAPSRNRFFKAVVQREGEGSGTAALLDMEQLFDAVKLA